jgi:hypothetical protein
MEDEEAAKKQSVVDLEELYVWLQQFEDPTIGKVMTYIISEVINFLQSCFMPIAVAERSKARTVFARSNTAIVGFNPTEAWMFVCVLCAFFLFLHSLK